MRLLSSMTVLCLLFLVVSEQGYADTIASDDFQSGDYSSWSASGDGEDIINLYQSNYSVRLDGLRQIQLDTSTADYQSVTLSMELAATDLVYGDYCYAEYSTDGGANWQQLGSIGVGASGGGFQTFTESAGLDNISQLSVRFRAYTLYDNFCYGDDLVLEGSPISGGTIASDDFQDGEYSDWSLSGDGNDSLNSYQGNDSMRLDGLRQATKILSTQGYDNVSLSMDMAALYLVSGDQCHAEYSTDGGQSWQNLQTLGNGQDDGAMVTATVSTGLDNLSQLSVRYRAYSLYGNYCYGDNLLLTGDPINTVNKPNLTVTGSVNFGNVQVGSSASSTLTLSNNGSATFTIDGLNAPTAPFYLTADNCSNQSLAAGENCQLTLEFSPASDGSVSQSLSISSNDPQSPENLMLEGVGVQAGSCDYDCLGGDGSTGRTQLGYNQLMTGSNLTLVDYSHYGVPASAADPGNTFSGKLSLTITPGTLTEQGTNLASAYTNPDSLPLFDFTFVQHGTHLIPEQRQVTNTGHTAWEWVLLPGRVWDENGDNGYSRVALPFALQEINANCTHNGVLTFLFKDDGSVSDVAYQVAQETCEYFKYNLHGQVEASYTPQVLANEQTLIDDYVQEVANRIEVRPLSELSVDYPNAGVVTGNIGSDQTASHLTAYGVYYQGVHYLGECQTRQGQYPFCEVMALPSYSTAKTIVGGLGLMRMEQKYGGSQEDLIVSNTVNACSGSQWTDVTLEQALDMATGNYDSSGDSVDEGSQKTVDEFFLVASHSDKISHACAYSRKANPGSTWVYHTSDTYILSRALQTYYEQQEGVGSDYYQDMLVQELFKPLNLSPLSYDSKRTYGNEAQVWGGYGLTLSGDDFVKLSRFMAQDDGQLGGQAMLDATMLADAMQQTSNGGLSTGTASSRYQNSVWAYDLSASSVVSCSQPTWVPYMSGFGGIGVVMLPNDMLYYYVSDNKEYGFTKTVKELTKISAVCAP